MAYITNIKLQNFYNYYGNDNKYNFNNGMNLIVADNNGGKSKLYNAFLLILRNEVIDSDKRDFDSLNESKGKFRILSDRAKKEAQVNDRIKTEVELSFETDYFIYTLKKYFYSTKINDKSPYKVENWQIEDLKKVIVRFDKEDNSTRLEDLDKEQQIINKILPSELHKFCMFQGEEVVNLVNQGFSNAVSSLTDLKKFEYLEIFINDMLSKADKKLRNKEKSNSNNQDEANRIDNEIENIEETIGNLSTTLETRNHELGQVESKIGELSKIIAEAEKQNKIFVAIGNNQEKIKTIVSEIEEFEKTYNQNFFYDKWILKGCESIKSKFDAIRSNYEETIARKNYTELNTPLPQDSPDIVSLGKMLRNEICLVCNRKATVGSPPYEHIKKLKEKHEAGRKREGNSPIKEICDILFKDTNNFSSDEEIESSLNEKRDSFKNLKEENNKFSKEKEELINQKVSNEKENQKIISDYYDQTNLKNRLERDISDIERKLQQYNSDKKRKKMQLDKLTEDDTSLDPLKRKVKILDDLLKVIKETKKRFYNDESRKYSNRINNIYESLTKGNETAPGIIKISVDKRFIFTAELENSEGGILAGQGAAFQRMKQLALVMGLLKESRRNSSYPLIADAPISEMGDILTQNFFYNIPKIFDQSIIFIKDFYKKGGELNEGGKKIIYESQLNMRVFMNEAIGKEQHERKTVIKNFI